MEIGTLVKDRKTAFGVFVGLFTIFMTFFLCLAQ